MESNSKKCVVWDLDNTIWKGTLLEGDELVLNAGVSEIVRELDRRGILVTDESSVRRKMYQADLLRKQNDEEFPGTREQFLATLGTIFTVRAATRSDLRRAEELTVRTNQLNTTGRTYSYEDLERLLDSPDYLLLVVDLEDRYGSSGTVGLVLIERGPDLWVVKLLLMSCRVMTRGVGGILISSILQAARRNDIRLRAEFVPNHRNRMMYMTYKMHGFYEVATKDDGIMLEHRLEMIRPFPVHVTVRAPCAEQGWC